MNTGAATYDFGYSQSGRGRIRLDIHWTGGRDPTKDDYGDGMIYLPRWDTSAKLPPGNYTLCYCTGDTFCHTDCDFFDRGDVLTVIPSPRLGPELTLPHSEPGSEGPNRRRARDMCSAYS